MLFKVSSLCEAQGQQSGYAPGRSEENQLPELLAWLETGWTGQCPQPSRAAASGRLGPPGSSGGGSYPFADC